YKFSSLSDALDELARLTGVARKKLKPEGKKADKGPCSKSSSYETGMHYTVKNDDTGDVVGSIGMCPCSAPGGGTSRRYAILNYTSTTLGNGGRPEEINQMRVQLQEGDNHLEDAVRQNKPDPGVTVSQLRNGLQELFSDGKGKIPSRLESSFLGAIAR